MLEKYAKDNVYYAVEPNKESFEFMQRKLKFVNGLNKEDVGFINNNFPNHKMDISFVGSVFYCMDYKKVYSVCKKLSIISDILIIGDELKNYYGNKTKLMKVECFNDDDRYSLCHPYKKMLAELGYKNIKICKAPELRVSLTGFMVAKK